MYIEEPKKTVNGKVYTSRLLRESYRDKNGKPQKRTILNLNKLPEEVADLIVHIVKMKHNLKLDDFKDFKHTQGKSYGAIKVVSEIMKTLGIKKALGNSRIGKISQMLLAGIILSPTKSKNYIANQWSKNQAVKEVFGIKFEYNENDLYKALSFLSDHQENIETKIRTHIAKTAKSSKKLFLYDVTSSYVEGEHIAFSMYGYNRDKKKGKKQIVIGLLTDEKGMPVSVEVFDGNTRDNTTVNNQLKKIQKRFNATDVVFVGDRGMIKSEQMKEIERNNWKYITGITRPQVESMMKKGIIQIGIFDESIKEISYEGERYILRKNPIRKNEIETNLKEKIQKLKEKVSEKNKYLKEHSKAKLEVAMKHVLDLQKKLKLTKLTEISKEEGRILSLIENKAGIEEKLSLAGCYVLKTDVPSDELTKEEVHSRYKDLFNVEEDFRNLKTAFLNIRPLHVRTESHVKGHVFACTLSLIVLRHVESNLKETGFTKDYVWECLEKIQYQNITYSGVGFKSIPSQLLPDQQKILDSLHIVLPKIV